MESKNKTDVFEREISLDKLSRNGIFIIPLWNLNMMTERVKETKEIFGNGSLRLL
jgi:hypothetical protein